MRDVILLHPTDSVCVAAQFVGGRDGGMCPTGGCNCWMMLIKGTR